MWNIKKIKKSFDIVSLYNEFNTKYFGNKLGECKFEDSADPCDYIPAVAAIEYRNKRNGTKGATIRFNSRIDWDEYSIRQVLLHELIHFYVFTRLGFCPCFQHGLFFIINMLRINIMHNEHVRMFWHGGKITWSRDRPC